MCLALGYAHPDHLLPDLSARQLKDWRGYARQHGLGPRRDDIHFGQLTALIHNAWRGADSPPVKPIDYMPYHERPELTQEELIASWRAWSIQKESTSTT